MSRRRFFKMILSIGLSVAVILVVFAVLPARSAVPHLGYGVNLYADVQSMLDMGFDWLKGFPDTNLAGYPVQTNILFRYPATYSNTLDVTAFSDDIYAIALQNKDYIDAWEIGNEVNISNTDYGWGAPPDATQYKTLLCAAYAQIKLADPTAIVVSAGLAPTGRVVGDYNGHPGNDGSKQDERQFLSELLDAGGGACLDAVGYHPYGYSADYDAAPDVASADPTQNCDQGFCFRGAEKIYEIMQQKGLGDKKVWATEFGWITQPPQDCLDNDPSWPGRAWQIVSDDKQASNLVGAYHYADEHWPWMGGMFIFNLDFSDNPGLSSCDQMRYYSVKGKPAEAALQAMSKNKAALTGQLQTDIRSLTTVIGVNDQPMTWTPIVNLSNAGWQPLMYTATVDGSASVVPSILTTPTGSLSATAQIPLLLSVSGFSNTPGTYTGTLTVDWLAAGPGSKSKTVALQMIVVTDVDRTYLPLISR